MMKVVWRALFRCRDWEQDLDDEIRDHLAHRTASLIRRGMASDEAARLDFGRADVAPVLASAARARRAGFPASVTGLSAGADSGRTVVQEQLLRMAMIVANFRGGEAEDLRRAMDFKRSEERMQKVEAKLRVGMTANGINPETQERIIQSITSFALYGFPESHAASFALIAYASAYLKCHYLAAFTACMLNHQPMGFYCTATLVKDAQRHGQRFRPVDVQVSDAVCRIEREGGIRFIRLGLNYVKGLSQRSMEALVYARENAGPFHSLTDLLRRVPSLNKKEGNALAELGALNRLPQRK